MTVHDFTVKGMDGQDVSLGAFAGKVLLIVNTATKCGYTKQYAGLQKLYDDNRDKGFEILDFPCNQFGGQAPGEIADIDNFCKLKFATTFPRFAKIAVNGKNEIPLYAFLKEEQKGALETSKIKWNFAKFLIDREGNVVARYGSDKKPEAIEEDILKLLGA
ncbi:MAG: glutathione peroxidase [Treponema sp.]|nr:glutathione peroxidase [Treponema sp.]